MRGKKLGLGLLQLGRPWGVHGRSVPDDGAAFELLKFALDHGLRFFDTAPAYGASEERLGRFLVELSPEDRRGITVATKFGEQWIPATGATSVDHSFDGLCRSLERSLRRLGHIDILQVHKATPAVLMSGDLARALNVARNYGVSTFGVSCSSMEVVRAAIGSRVFSHLQFPFNINNSAFQGAFRLASEASMEVIVNRPFAEGAAIDNSALPAFDTAVRAFGFILRQEFTGFVLTGTKRIAHLAENILAFHSGDEACPKCQDGL